MTELFTIIKEDKVLLLTMFVTLLITMVYSIIVRKMRYYSRIREMELKNAMVENRNSESKNAVEEIITHIPEGVN